MDIKQINLSWIRRYKDEGYMIEIPSFVWHCESVFYRYDGNLIDYQFSQWWIIDIEDLSPDTEIGILMSSIFWESVVRILDFEHPYKNHLIFLKNGKISSFQIRWKSYFVFFYTQMNDEVWYFSNFETGSIFLVWFENNTFTIYNRSLGSILFQEHFEPTEESLEKTIEIPLSEKEWTIWVMHDPLLWEKEISLLRDFLWYLDPSYIRQNQNGIIMELSSSYIWELHKLWWILWSHQIIFDIPIYPSFLSMEELWDMELESASDFSLSEDILSFDNWWYTLRKNLLEIQYILHILWENKKLLSWSIKEINILGNNHLDFQKKRSILTLQDIEKVEESFRAMYTMLISLWKNILS